MVYARVVSTSAKSFDYAVSEYGAAIWCDPYRWIPEAARVLRPGGRLMFIRGTPLLSMTYPTHDYSAPAEPTLHRDYFGMHRFEWHDEKNSEWLAEVATRVVFEYDDQEWR